MSRSRAQTHNWQRRRDPPHFLGTPPVEAGKSPETLRGHTLKIGEQFRNAAAVKPAVVAPTITISLDSTFIRSCLDGERHLEVRVGNVETQPDCRLMSRVGCRRRP